MLKKLRTDVIEWDLKWWFDVEDSWLWHQRWDFQQSWDLKHEFSELFDVDINVENWRYFSS